MPNRFLILLEEIKTMYKNYQKYIKIYQSIQAGPEGIEPPIAVLETAVIPFNYGPIKTLLFYHTHGDGP